MRVRLVGDAGAYRDGSAPPNVDEIHGKRHLQSSQTAFRYRCGHYEYTPTGAYRGAGRPEATALFERAMDQAA